MAPDFLSGSNGRTAQLLSAVAAACLVISLGLGLYRLANHGGGAASLLFAGLLRQSQSPRSLQFPPASAHAAPSPKCCDPNEPDLIVRVLWRAWLVCLELGLARMGEVGQWRCRSCL
jgi:hypothetical protein